MLKSMDGDEIKKVPHANDFDSVQRRLGMERLGSVRAALNRIIDEMTPDSKTGRRTFSSSHLGSKLDPWPYPLAHLYDVASEILGDSAEERDVHDRSALIFGLFVWECIMHRDEEWMFYDPNLSSRDPNREITGKIYFER
jgi:hypothetical protein